MIEKNINLNQDLIVSQTTVLPLNFNEPELLSDALYEKLKNIHIIIAADGSLNCIIFIINKLAELKTKYIIR